MPVNVYIYIYMGTEMDILVPGLRVEVLHLTTIAYSSPVSTPNEKAKPI